jgi:hypothetical protein
VCICGHEKVPAGHLPDAFSGLSDAFFALADMAFSRWHSRPLVRVWDRRAGRGDRQQLAGNRASAGLRPSLRLCLRPSLHLRLHRSTTSKVRNCRSQRALRDWRFADISTQPPGRNIRRNRGSLIVLSILSASLALALAACAIASALAPQRFAGSTAPIALGATAIASALATHRLLASALASQRSGGRRPRAWRFA